MVNLHKVSLVGTPRSLAKPVADVQELVASLGEPMPVQDMPHLPQSASAPASTSSLASLANPPASAPMSRSLSADEAVLSEVITELVTTERTYFKRLCMLKSVSALSVSTWLLLTSGRV